MRATNQRGIRLSRAILDRDNAVGNGRGRNYVVAGRTA